MEWLLIGDIVSSPGRSAIRDYLKDRKDQYDLIIANAENAAGGFGLTSELTQEIIEYGVDVLTGGNHIWKQKDFVETLAEEPDRFPVIRPANYPRDAPGRGHRIFKVNGVRVLIINLQGRTFMETIDCPFQEAKKILDRENFELSIIDFHAEATSEKIALAKYVADQITAFVGTHTHVQTADERLIHDETAYITDLGMTGPLDSIIGVRDELATKRFLTGRPVRFKVEKQGPRIFNGLEITVDPDNKKAVEVNRVYEKMAQRTH